MAALIEKEKEERQAAILAAKSKGKYDRLYLVYTYYIGSVFS